MAYMPCWQTFSIMTPVEKIKKAVKREVDGRTFQDNYRIGYQNALRYLLRLIENHEQEDRDLLHYKETTQGMIASDREENVKDGCVL